MILQETFIIYEEKLNTTVRLGDWKIVKHGSKNAWESFNMKDDPGECINLAVQYPDKVGELDLLYTN